MSYKHPAQEQVKQSGAEIKKKAIIDIEDMRIESDPV